MTDGVHNTCRVPRALGAHNNNLGESRSRSWRIMPRQPTQEPHPEERGFARGLGVTKKNNSIQSPRSTQLHQNHPRKKPPNRKLCSCCGSLTRVKDSCH